MIQQWQPSLRNKFPVSGETVPIGNYLTNINYASSERFFSYPEDNIG